jgi:hypothetical protein
LGGVKLDTTETMLFLLLASVLLRVPFLISGLDAGLVFGDFLVEEPSVFGDWVGVAAFVETFAGVPAGEDPDFLSSNFPLPES